MRRNCNLNRQIVQSNGPPSSSSMRFCNQLQNFSEQNRINISYSDATELQAMAILWLARREMEEKHNNVPNNGSPISLQLQLQGSLKKSLKKFLQKRKDRINQASMPY